MVAPSTAAATGAVPVVVCVSSRIGNPITPWSIVGTSYPYPGEGDWASNSVSRTQSQSYTLGVAANKGSGWRADGISSLSSTSGFNWGSDSPSFLENDWEYEATQIYQEWRNSCPPGPEYLPEGLAGGFGQTQVSWTGFSWNCQSEGVGTWSHQVSSSSDFSLGGGVLISGTIGFNLSIDTGYDSSRDLYYQLNTSGRPLCGSNRFPGTAAQVSEF